MPIWTDYFHLDAWLSKILEREVYSFSISDFNTNLSLKKSRLPDKCFVYCKVATNNQTLVQLVQSLGFVLADTQIQLEKKILLEQPHNHPPTDRIRWSTPLDRKRVVEIARNSFIYSRFHRDPLIQKKQADQIKANWVDNYFNGLRGNGLLIAEVDAVPAAFLMLIENKNHWIIDLIATDPNFQKMGLGTELLNAFENWAPKSIKFLNVGTQLINLPSLQLYLRNGYHIKNSYYIFHYHQEEIS